MATFVVVVLLVGLSFLRFDRRFFTPRAYWPGEMVLCHGAAGVVVGAESI